METSGQLASVDPEARERDEIETDRDSFTPAITTVARRLTILEAAYTFSENRHAREGHSFPELLVRYGLMDGLELRLGWNYEISAVVGEPELPTTSATERESRVVYGLKYRLTEHDGWVPGSALILQGFTPTSGPSSDTRLVATYAFGWELPRRMRLDAAVRFATETEDEDHFHEWAPSVVLKVPVGEHLSVHAEYFAIFSAGRFEEFSKHYFSPGVHYLVNDNLEVGVRGGWGLNDQSARFFVNAGVGWRF